MTDTTQPAAEARETTPALNQAQLDAQTKAALANEAEINKVIAAEVAREDAEAKAEAKTSAPAHHPNHEHENRERAEHEQREKTAQSKPR